MSKYDLIRATLRVLEVAEFERDNPPMPQSTKERQEALRAKRAMLGMTEVRGIYLPPDRHAELKAYAKKLQKAKKPLDNSSSAVR